MRSSSSASRNSSPAAATILASLLALALLSRANEPVEPDPGAARLADRLAAAEQSAAALRHRARELSEELERRRSENESLRRRLDEANARLAAVSRVAAAAEAEREGLVRQAREDAARIRALEARLAAAPPAEGVGGMREVRALLEERTRELAELRRKVAELEAAAREASPRAPPPPAAATQPEEIRRLHEMFAAEKKTWQSLYELSEEHRVGAETERDRLREELRQTRSRLDELEQRLRARDAARAAALPAGTAEREPTLRDELQRERAAREVAEMRAEAFRRAWMSVRPAGTNPPTEPARPTPAGR